MGKGQGQARIVLSRLAVIQLLYQLIYQQLFIVDYPGIHEHLPWNIFMIQQ